MIGAATAPAPRATDVRLYDASDVRWISTIVDHVVASAGRPWRELRERLDHSPIGTAKVNAILGALRRVLGGRAERVRIARKVRSLVLGPPALDEGTRIERLLGASRELGIDVESVRELLWIDLANERPVALPHGRPDELRLAAYANLDRIQHAVRRARMLNLRVCGEAHELIRMAARCGLIVTITADGPATVLDVVGPLSLFHATSVYGRALAALVPLLADHSRFELTIDCDFGHGPAVLRVAPPALLPPSPVARGKPSLALSLARQLINANIEVALDPPVIAHGRTLLYPDLELVVGERRWLVELVGFATADYLSAKLSRYRAAGLGEVVLCVDQRRAPDARIDPQVLAYASKLTGEAVLRFVEGLA
ncbi:hypothetical protein BH11MYX3_BH11MYX3_26860 [soil metagenome]